MSYPRQVQFNAGEQIVSGDFNNLEGFAGQELSDVLARLLALTDSSGASAGALAGLGVLPNLGGVLSGFEIASVSGLTVTFNPGLAFRVDSTPPALGAGGAATQSPWRWIKATAQVAVTLANQPAASVALIEVTDATSSPAAQSRNQWVVTSQSVQAVALTKEVDPSYSIKIKYANSPSVPTVDAGYIPLALAYVPASPGVLSGSMTVDVRGMLHVGALDRQGVCSGLALGTPAQGSSTIASGSNGLVLPQATIDVASSTPFASTGGVAYVQTSSGMQTVAYTGTAAGQLTGCSGGGGTMSTGGAVMAVSNALTLTAGQAWARDTNLSTGFAGVSPTVRVTVPSDLGFAEPGSLGVTWLGDTSADSIGTAGQANKAFYAYLVPNTPTQPVCATSSAAYSPAIGANGSALALTTTAPLADGSPSSVFQITNHDAPTTGVIDVTQAVFVGSVCTDASGNIIPFTRVGDRVLFSGLPLGAIVPVDSYGIGFPPGGGYAKQAGITSTLAVTYATLVFGTGNAGHAPIAPPSSAVAMIADVFGAGGTTNTIGPAYVLMGSTQSNAGIALCTVYLPPSGASSATPEPFASRMELAGGGGNPFQVTLAIPQTAGADSYEIAVVFAGYVEPIAHLTV